MYKPFSKTKDKKPTQAKNVIGKVIENLGIKDRIIDFELLNLWEEVAGEKLAKDTFAYRMIKSKTLVVGVKTAVLANELQFLKKDLEKKFNNLASGKYGRTIDKIVFELRQKEPETRPNNVFKGLTNP